MQKKLNWKVRFKNKVWLTAFLSLIIGFVYNMLKLFDVYPTITQNTIIDIISQVLTFLGLFGVVVDPTTEGMFDSERALSYDEPWSDAAQKDETEEHEEDAPEETEE